jgi:thymidylate synthase (FAD)
MLLGRGHESVLEHEKVTLRLICDRGVSHEIVRHRIGSYSQESTRYCNYAGERFGREITCVRPGFWKDGDACLELWRQAMLKAESAYFALLDAGAKPEEARSVLPNSLKTEIVVTYNLREWRHFLRLRLAPAAHPQIRELAYEIQSALKKTIPIVFDD